MPYSKKYYLAHREEILQKQREYYARDPEKYLSKCRKWQAEHQDYMKAYKKAYAFTHARKARKATANWRKKNAEYNRLYGKLYGAWKYAQKKGNLQKATSLRQEIDQLIAKRKIIKAAKNG